MKDTIDDSVKNKRMSTNTIGFHMKNLLLLVLLYTLTQFPYEVAILSFSLGKTYSVPRSFSTIISLVVLLLFVGLGYKIAKHLKIVNMKDIFIKKNFIFIVLGFLALQLVGYLSIFLQGGQTGRVDLYSATIQNSSGITLFFLFTLVLPILEEIIFRGFILGYWFKESPTIGLIVSVTFFTLIHFPNNVVIFMQYFMTSLIYAIIYQKAKRLEITVGMHILNNLPAGLQILFNLF